MSEIYKIGETIFTCFSRKVTSMISTIFDEEQNQSVVFSLYPEKIPYRASNAAEKYFFELGYNKDNGLSLISQNVTEKSSKSRSDILTEFTSLKKEKPEDARDFFDNYGFIFNIKKYTQVTYNEILVWQKHLIKLIQLYDGIKEYNLMREEISKINNQDLHGYKFDYSKLFEPVLYFATKKVIETKFSDKVIKKSNELLFNKLLNNYLSIFEYKHKQIYLFEAFSEDDFYAQKRLNVYRGNDETPFGSYSIDEYDFASFLDDYLNKEITYEQLYNKNAHRKKGFLFELAVRLIYENCSDIFADDELTRKLVMFFYHLTEEVTKIAIVNDGEVEFQDILNDIDSEIDKPELISKNIYETEKNIDLRNKPNFYKFHELLVEIANLLLDSEVNYHLKNISYSFDSSENKIKCKSEDLYSALVFSILLKDDLTIYEQCIHCGGLFAKKRSNKKTKCCSEKCQKQYNNAICKAKKSIRNESSVEIKN